MVKLKRMARFEVDKGIISQFQLDSDRFNRRIKTIISKDDRELKYQYTDLSGYITLYGEDVEEIIVLWELKTLYIHGNTETFKFKFIK